MRVEREMRAVEGDVVVEEQAQAVVGHAADRLHAAPEQAVVHDAAGSAPAATASWIVSREASTAVATR